MKFKIIKSAKIKLLLMIIIFVCLLHGFHQRFFLSSSCSSLYNSNSFYKCALSNKTCNITILLNSYLTYRTCVLKNSISNVDYVVFDAVNGLGNRLLGLISVTTYALVTGRILFIHWKPGDNHLVDFKDLFQPLSSIEKIPIYYQYSFYRLFNSIKYRWINELEWKSKQSRIPRDWSFYFDREILCYENSYTHSWLEKMGFHFLNKMTNHLKWIRTDQYFVPLLKRNRELRGNFEKIFKNGEVFSHIANQLLNPIKPVRLIVEQFEKDYLSKDNIITIGVHMRSWSSAMTDHVEPFQKCITHLINNLTQSINNTNQIYLYIISNTFVRRQKLEHQISETHKNIHTLKAPIAPQTANDAVKMQYTLAELLILSKMQHLIITSKSTFGMAAQGLAYKGAWIVRQGAAQEINKIQSDTCEWESSSEPEYQMMGTLQNNDNCIREGVLSPSIGERTTL